MKRSQPEGPVTRHRIWLVLFVVRSTAKPNITSTIFQKTGLLEHFSNPDWNLSGIDLLHQLHSSIRHQPTPHVTNT